LDQKPLPFGIEIENRLMGMAPIKNLVLEGQKPFYLAVSLRQKKTSSLRSRRLGGENFILDKHGFK